MRVLLITIVLAHDNYWDAYDTQQLEQMIGNTHTYVIRIIDFDIQNAIQLDSHLNNREERNVQIRERERERRSFL